STGRVRVTATFMPKSWDEKTYAQDSPGTKITRSSVVYQYTGEMEGEGSAECLMFYSSYDEQDPHRAAAEYIGLIRFTGTLNGKGGDFVLEEKGAYGGGTARSSLRILPGSGTKALAGISGTGTTLATAKTCQVELEYVLP
ncbi:MAG TPA: DUF3224 domain-containing protein, partial [Bacteroidota bacterium]|nr:DUF3224 domain-containing protein [Bacteroidota bacterium]